MRDIFRDKTRDRLAYALKSLGVHAEMARRGQIEERIHKKRPKRSLGVIFVTEGRVKWINVLKRDRSRNSSAQWWIVLCIPDWRPDPERNAVRIRTIGKKVFPIFGRIVKVIWKGQDNGTGLVAKLSRDEAIEQMCINIGNLEIRSCSKEFSGWTLQVDRPFTPTMKDWESIQLLARHLLSSSPN